MPYVASSNLGYYSVVYSLTLFLLICVGESLEFVFFGEHSKWRLIKLVIYDCLSFRSGLYYNLSGLGRRFDIGW